MIPLGCSIAHSTPISLSDSVGNIPLFFLAPFVFTAALKTMTTVGTTNGATAALRWRADDEHVFCNCSINQFEPYSASKPWLQFVRRITTSHPFSCFSWKNHFCQRFPSSILSAGCSIRVLNRTSPDQPSMCSSYNVYVRLFLLFHAHLSS